MNKVKVFEKELSWIVNPQIRAFAEKLIECAPDYFFEVAASSTGKYHPTYSLGPGGLARHSKSAAMFMHELCGLGMFNKYSQDKKDMMLVAIIAHDFFKHGLPEKASKYTVAQHPTVCRDYIRSNPELCAMLNPDQIQFITECIAKHMGMFSTDYKTGKKILPEPETGPENLTHLADYLASRKWITVDFGDDYYQPVKEEPTEDDKSNPELDAIKADIVAKCKVKIEAGVKQKDIYAIVAAENDGNRNPNSITNMEIARSVLEKVEGLGVPN